MLKKPLQQMLSMLRKALPDGLKGDMRRGDLESPGQSITASNTGLGDSNPHQYEYGLKQPDSKHLNGAHTKLSEHADLSKTQSQRAAKTEALRASIAHVGSQRLLAESLGLKQGHISVWLNRDGQVPAERVLAVEAATGGWVSRYALRPDVYGPPPSLQQLLSATLKSGWRQIQPPIKQFSRIGATAVACGVFILALGSLWQGGQLNSISPTGMAPYLAEAKCLDCELINSCPL